MSETCKRVIGLLPLLLLAAALTACGPSETATPCPPTPECPECPEAECPECPECPEPVVSDVPFQDLWVSSGHADAEAEAFRHWDEDDPAEVPTRCAKCHSAPGYLDFLGVDGTEAGVVDNAAEIGTVVNCTVCHNEATVTMTSVTFPSGMEVTGLGDESRCYQCHQGRASTQDVNTTIEEAGVDADAVSEDLGFINIHYFAAAASRLGKMAAGGYQYDGKPYDAKFAHVQEFDTCFECHDPHSLELRVGSCSECHTGVGGQEDLKNIRLQGSTKDYDGDGNVDEGIYFEIEGLQEALLVAMQAYASDVAGTPIVYDAASYPYFFIDSDGDGEPSEEEAAYNNQYASWTPRLLKAAYNYQTSTKDPGNYAHGGKYHIQLLYDSIEDLDEGLVEGLSRADAGHFDGSAEAFRHWDEDGEVSASCAKCHSATGLQTVLKEGVSVSEPIANGFQCRTCHDAVPGYTLPAVNEVTFPSGASASFGEGAPSNLCLQCHQGRESTVSVRADVGDLGADAVSEDLGFSNVHYFAAGATLFGTEVKGAYEYEGQTYLGRFEHVDGFNECTECHTAHGLTVKVEGCSGCHDGVETEEDLHGIRMAETDFDGDGDTDEGLAGEVDTIRDALYAGIQTYAAETAGTPIVYDAHAYPYFFIDTNGNGEPDEDEASYGNRYASWTPRLLKAAYNYQYAAKDPGAFAHNGQYVLQVLYDSLADIGGSTAGMTRPASE
ncbi:MAG: cytochrome c3 family protein [Anaerolineae bacterium]|jgi:hypothetical protein